MAEAIINPEIIAWAIGRSSLTAGDVGLRISVSAEKINDWITGKRRPTFKQAQALANALRIPFGYLYLPRPPEDRTPVAEFRTVEHRGVVSNVDVHDLLSDIEYKRDWFREYRIEAGFEEFSYVGRYSSDTPTELVSSDMRTTLQSVDPNLFVKRNSFERLLDRLLSAAEQIGLWIIRSGVVGNNTHRVIDVDILRGFALSDKHVPLIFINSRDATAAQVFTFAHELAHIWLGKSTLEVDSIERIAQDKRSRLEKKCDDIAAEFLVPAEAFRKVWISDQPVTAQASSLAQRFSVSPVVIARRAFSLELLAFSDYRNFYQAEKKRWSEGSSHSRSGGSYYNVVPVRNGKSFTRAVLREAGSGRIGYREAGTLLSVQASKVRALQQRSIAG